MFGFLKKKESREQRTEWNAEMISSFASLIGSSSYFSCSPYDRKSNVTVSDKDVYRKEIYIGKCNHFEELDDVLVHIVIVDKDKDYTDYSNDISDIGYFRLVNYQEIPRIYVYLKDRGGFINIIKDYFKEAQQNNRRFCFYFEFDGEFILKMDEQKIVGNKESNNIPISKYNFGLDDPSFT